MDFSNELYISLSPLSLYNKVLNGLYGSYSREKMSIDLIFTKIDDRKKDSKIQW
ncbi:MAG: hypothetical protein ACP5PT_04620 [Brevinematia bacterium]|jgi:hypothetical protein